MCVRTSKSMHVSAILRMISVMNVCKCLYMRPQNSNDNRPVQICKPFLVTIDRLRHHLIRATAALFLIEMMKLFSKYRLQQCSAKFKWNLLGWLE